MEHLYKPMWRKPKLSPDDENISVTVLVYELDFETKEVNDVDFGYYNFRTDEWHVLGDFSMMLMCWCEIPTPTVFMQGKDWEVVAHHGFQD